MANRSQVVIWLPENHTQILLKVILGFSRFSINTKEYAADEFAERNIQNSITEIKSDIQLIKEKIVG